MANDTKRINWLAENRVEIRPTKEGYEVELVDEGAYVIGKTIREAIDRAMRGMPPEPTE